MSMYFRNILVPYDESDHALSALHTALAMVGDEPDAKVHVVTIIPARALPGVPFTGDGFDVSPTVVNPESHNQLMDVLMSRTRTDLQQVVKESLDGVRCKVSVDAVIDASPLWASRITSRTTTSTSWSWGGAAWARCAACSAA